MAGIDQSREVGRLAAGLSNVDGVGERDHERAGDRAAVDRAWTCNGDAHAGLGFTRRRNSTTLKDQ